MGTIFALAMCVYGQCSLEPYQLRYTTLPACRAAAVSRQRRSGTAWLTFQCVKLQGWEPVH